MQFRTVLPLLLATLLFSPECALATVIWNEVLQTVTTSYIAGGETDSNSTSRSDLGTAQSVSNRVGYAWVTARGETSWDAISPAFSSSIVSDYYVPGPSDNSVTVEHETTVEIFTDEDAIVEVSSNLLMGSYFELYLNDELMFPVDEFGRITEFETKQFILSAGTHTFSSYTKSVYPSGDAPYFPPSIGLYYSLYFLPVPEPSAATLSAFSILLLGPRRRRQH